MPNAADTSSPAWKLAQQQLDAYNRGDLEAFLDVYSEDIEIYNYPGILQSKGKADMRARYTESFANSPDLHSELLTRVTLGDVAIDHEQVTGLSGDKLKAIAIYTVRDNKIARMEFIFQQGK